MTIAIAAIAAIDRTVDVAQLTCTGIVVEVIPARDTRLIRFRVYPVSGDRRRGGRIATAAAKAAPRGKRVLTVFKRAPRNRGVARLTRKDPRGLRPRWLRGGVDPGAQSHAARAVGGAPSAHRR